MRMVKLNTFRSGVIKSPAPVLAKVSKTRRQSAQDTSQDPCNVCLQCLSAALEDGADLCPKHQSLNVTMWDDFDLTN